MTSKSNKFLLFGIVFFIITSLFSSFLSKTHFELYSEEFSRSFGKKPDPLSTSSDYFNGYRKYKEIFIPVPIKSRDKALSFIERFVSNVSNEKTGKSFVLESKGAIESSQKTSSFYLSDSTYLSNGEISLCLINLRDDFNYPGLKAIALEHEMAHCYLETRGIKNIFRDLLPVRFQKVAEEKIISKVGKRNLERYLISYNHFLTELYADAMAIYRPGVSRSQYVDMVVSDRSKSFILRKDEQYATNIILKDVDFNYEDIDKFETHLVRLLSSDEALEKFLKLI